MQEAFQKEIKRRVNYGTTDFMIRIQLVTAIFYRHPLPARIKTKSPVLKYGVQNPVVCNHRLPFLNLILQSRLKLLIYFYNYL